MKNFLNATFSSTICNLGAEVKGWDETLPIWPPPIFELQPDSYLVIFKTNFLPSLPHPVCWLFISLLLLLHTKPYDSSIFFESSHFHVTYLYRDLDMLKACSGIIYYNTSCSVWNFLIFNTCILMPQLVQIIHTSKIINRNGLTC